MDNEEDALGEFMVDTDDEDDGHVGPSQSARRMNAIQEVPDTPQK